MQSIQPTIPGKAACWIGGDEQDHRLRPHHKHIGAKPVPTLRALAVKRTATSRQSAGSRHLQSVAVRVFGKAGGTIGNWKAFGRYLQREGACLERAGFTRNIDRVNGEKTLAGWYAAGDTQYQQIILSPESADTQILKQFTRAVMERASSDLGVSLDWVAGIHTNTDHPHVHLALRQISPEGRAVELSRDYLYHALRIRAREELTRMAGYRMHEPHRSYTRERVNEHTRKV